MARRPASTSPPAGSLLEGLGRRTRGVLPRDASWRRWWATSRTRSSKRRSSMSCMRTRLPRSRRCESERVSSVTGGVWTLDAPLGQQSSACRRTDAMPRTSTVAASRPRRWNFARNGYWDSRWRVASIVSLMWMLPSTQPAATRFRTGCNGLSEHLARAPVSSDHALEPNSVPDPHQTPSKLDPGLDHEPRCHQASNIALSRAFL